MFECFEIFNDKGHRVFITHDKMCIPKKEDIDSMLSNSYKIKLDNKNATKKMINELYSNKKG